MYSAGEKHPINDESVGTSSEPVTIAEAEFETEGFAKESSQDLQEDISDTNDILDANSVEYEEHSGRPTKLCNLLDLTVNQHLPVFILVSSHLSCFILLHPGFCAVAWPTSVLSQGSFKIRKVETYFRT